MNRRLFAAIFLLLFLVVGAQSLGTPRGAGPDEPAHLVRAGGIVRGDVFGTALTDDDAVRSFDVPGWVGQPDPGCFSFDPSAPASCAAVVPTTGPVISSAGSYQVWAHLLPGLGTLVPGEAATVWVSRLLGALLPVALIAAAIAVCLERSRRVDAAVVLFALTPTALFSIAVVNPSGMAIGGAVAMWAGGLIMTKEDRAPALLFAAGWAALVLSRGDGVVWCAVILVLLLMWREVGIKAAWAMLSQRARVLLVVPTILAIGWSLAVRPALIADPESATGRALVTKIVGESGLHVREAIGVVGWLDTPIPTTMLYAWILTLGALVGIVALAGTRRHAAVIGLAVVAVIVLPWIFEFVQASQAGLFWQGRYGLPLFIGIVMLVGASGVQRLGDVAGERMLALVGASTWVVWNVSFLQELRRWAVGTDGSMLPVNWDVGIGTVMTVLVALVHVAMSALLIGLVVRWTDATQATSRHPTL